MVFGRRDGRFAEESDSALFFRVSLWSGFRCSVIATRSLWCAPPRTRRFTRYNKKGWIFSGF